MENNKIAFQDNAITTAKYEFSEAEKDIMYMLLGQIKKNDAPGQMYYISAKEMQEKTGGKVRYEILRDATKSIMSKVFEIVKENGNLLQVHLFSSAEYIKGAGMIEVGISPKIHPYLFDLKSNFTTFQLDMALSMKGKYSKRLYEMLSQHKRKGKVVTWEITVDDLRTRLNLVNTYNYGMFESRVLNAPIKEINAFTDLEVSYRKRKKGRSYHWIEFDIKYTPHQMKIDFQDEDSALMGKLVNEFKLRRDQALKVVEVFSSKEIHQKLYDIRTQSMNGKVENIGGYTAKIFGVNKK